MIPQASPAKRILRYRQEIDEAVAAVLEEGSYVLGAKLEAFESDFAQSAGRRHCIGVGSGTDALALALRGLGIGSGREVITTALTAPATAQAVLHCGASLRFVDVDAVTRCIDPSCVAAAINARTAAIIAVHLFGYPCDMPALASLAERHGLVLIEDCAQSHGATLQGRLLGTFGHAACYSFYPTKNLGCVGDGGAVVTDDGALAQRIRSLRNYGFEGQSRISDVLGFNSRLDDIQAAILSALLPHLKKGNDERRAIAARYRKGLRSTKLGMPPDDPGCVYHQFAITCAERDALRACLRRGGIDSAVHYTPALHHHPAFLSSDAAHLPITDGLAATLLSLPIQPEIAGPAVEQTVAAVIEFASS